VSLALNYFLHRCQSELSIQSDNASCLASHDNIAYMHHLNKERAGQTVIQWIYTEAQTGEGRLDAHFSFVNIVMSVDIKEAELEEARDLMGAEDLD
jgi:hypothetical protein